DDGRLRRLVPRRARLMASTGQSGRLDRALQSLEAYLAALRAERVGAGRRHGQVCVDGELASLRRPGYAPWGIRIASGPVRPAGSCTTPAAAWARSTASAAEFSVGSLSHKRF